MHVHLLPASRKAFLAPYVEQLKIFAVSGGGRSSDHKMRNDN